MAKSFWHIWHIVSALRMPVFLRLSAATIIIIAAITAPATHAQTTDNATEHTANHAAVIMYHRFGESGFPSTNTTLEQFAAHLDEISKGGYHVMPLIDITRAIMAGEGLPDRTVAITIDDAFGSVYDHAFPMLQSRGLAFTVFVSTDAIDRNLPGYATWEQLREMHAAGVDFGSQTHTHPHMHRLSLDEARDEIKISNTRFMEEMGFEPELLAYPYGEYTPEIRDFVMEAGFIAAFGQHSGIMSTNDHPFEFPRFALNENYGDLKRLKLILNALPLPFSDYTPESMVLEDNPPFVGFTVKDGIEPIAQINCFASATGQAQVEILSRRVEIRLPHPITGERGRINCTMPYILDGQDTGRWRWLGRQFLPG